MESIMRRSAKLYQDQTDIWTGAIERYLAYSTDEVSWRRHDSWAFVAGDMIQLEWYDQDSRGYRDIIPTCYLFSMHALSPYLMEDE